MRDHVRLTAQPFDSPPDQAGVEQLIDQIGSDDMLLFATDYPHWQFDGDDLNSGSPSGIHREAHAHDNPLETFPRLAPH